MHNVPSPTMLHRHDQTPPARGRLFCLCDHSIDISCYLEDFRRFFTCLVYVFIILLVLEQRNSGCRETKVYTVVKHGGIWRCADVQCFSSVYWAPRATNSVRFGYQILVCFKSFLVRRISMMQKVDANFVAQRIQTSRPYRDRTRQLPQSADTAPPGTSSFLGTVFAEASPNLKRWNLPSEKCNF